MSILLMIATFTTSRRGSDSFCTKKALGQLVLKSMLLRLNLDFISIYYSLNPMVVCGVNETSAQRN